MCGTGEFGQQITKTKASNCVKAQRKKCRAGSARMSDDRGGKRAEDLTKISLERKLCHLC